MIKYIFILLVGGLLVVNNNTNISFESSTPLSKLEKELGRNYTKKLPNTKLKNVSVENGMKIVHEGFSMKSNGKKSRKQSKHFVCTSCHNVEKEDFDLSVSNPEARLSYVVDKGLPFLQGTTLYGAVNRSTYYNGDYDKKYGKLVEPARNDIRGAIQLCAVECAQGRKLKDWELESVLAYLWTLELKVGDLNLNEDEKNSILNANDMQSKQKSLEIISSKYLSGSPATFIPPPPDRKQGSGLVGNAQNGAKIYEASCLHCHKDGRYSYLQLDKSALSLNHLKRHISKYSHHSLYQVVRWGVPSKAGKKSYMPQYPVEKLSEQQLADLRAYIES